MNATNHNIEFSEEFMAKMLNWADRFGIFCFTHGNGYDRKNSFRTYLAAGARRSVSLTPGNAFGALKDFFEEQPSWLFGHISYDLMAETLNVGSRHAIENGFGYGRFFEPEVLISISNDSIQIETADYPGDVLAEILSTESVAQVSRKQDVRPGISQSEYLDIITGIRRHIKAGDCYELNFCQPFYADDVIADPVSLFAELMRISPNPFSALYKTGDDYCLCASPERFLRKEGSQVISQPMKGTARRGRDEAEDNVIRESMGMNSKERSENVMIVDLVRNDLSKIAAEGSVTVTDLFGIQTFPHVHQMVSTVTAEARQGVHWTEIIAACFPMGSMTGAPKKRVAELIDKYEKESRGLYSGSVGYVSPDGDFDLNVVIRSLFYNRNSEKARFWAGGGITYESLPEREYEECLLKAKAIRQLLNPGDV